MLAAIVRASLRNPRIVTALACLIAALGVAALLAARFDVFPDFAPPHVLVQTEAPGLDAVQVEALVTRPLEGLLAGTENVKSVRSTSSQGLSAIQVVFDRGGDPYRQRQVVTERLAEFAGQLPPGVGAPLLSPLSSSMEYLVHFGYTSDRLSPVELRDVVQWIVKPQILAVPGVAQAQIFGGAVRERQIDIDPAKLAATGLALDDVLGAARRATALIGGGYVETPTQRIVIKAQAPGATIDALAQAVVGTRGGQPVRLGDIGDGARGSRAAFRRCAHRRAAGHPHRNLDSIRRQYSGSHAGAGTKTRCARTVTGQAGSAVSSGAAAPGQLHRERHREAAQFTGHRRRARRRAVADHPARLAGCSGLLQRHPARAVDHGLDSGSLGLEPQHHDAGRPGGRAGRGGR